MAAERPTPQVFNPPKDEIPIAHPRGGEYQLYARRIRFPKPFWEWLELTDAQAAGKSFTGARLQRMMDDEKFCAAPLKTRVHRGVKRR